MPSNAGRRGAGWEWTLAQRLRAAGWHVVRSSGSHGPVDLYAWDPDGTLWLVQAKTAGAHRPGPADRRLLREVAVRTGGWPVVVSPGPRGQPPVWVEWDAGRWHRVAMAADGAKKGDSQ